MRWKSLAAALVMLWAGVWSSGEAAPRGRVLRTTLLTLEERPFLWLGQARASLEVGPGKAFSSIQAALDQAQSGDVVWVDPGEYKENLLFPPRDVALIAREGPRKTFIDGRGCARGEGQCSTLSLRGPSRPWIEGFTLMAGRGELLPEGDAGLRDPWTPHSTPPDAPRLGGGILIRGATPVIARCLVTFGKATHGGALAVLGDAPSLIMRPLLSLASARQGGAQREGVRLGPRAAATVLVDVDLVDNEARMGGGIYLDGAALSISGGRIAGNAAGQGGGIWAAGARLFLSQVEMLKDRAQEEGGVMFLTAGTRASVVESALVEGSAAQGSLIYVADARAEVESSWLAFPRRGPGLSGRGGSALRVVDSTWWSPEETLKGAGVAHLDVLGESPERDPGFYDLQQRRPWQEDNLGAWRRGAPSAVESVQVGQVKNVQEERALPPTEEELIDEPVGAP